MLELNFYLLILLVHTGMENLIYQCQDKLNSFSTFLRIFIRCNKCQILCRQTSHIAEGCGSLFVWQWNNEIMNYSSGKDLVKACVLCRPVLRCPRCACSRTAWYATPGLPAACWVSRPSSAGAGTPSWTTGWGNHSYVILYVFRLQISVLSNKKVKPELCNN